MKREILSEAIGNIEDKYIEEADAVENREAIMQDSGVQRAEGLRQVKTKIRRSWFRQLALAACIALCIVGVGGFAVFKIAHPWGIKMVTVEGKKGATEPLLSTARLPRWEERAVNHQYNNMEWDGVEYDSAGSRIPADRIGEYLGEVVAWGEDYYAKDEESRRERKAKVYAITKLSTEWLVAVQYEDCEGFYGFEKHWFIPKTMGEFLEKMNIYEEATFGRVSYDYVNAFGEYTTICFDDVSAEMIYKYLLSSPEAVNAEDQFELFQRPREILGISTSIPIEGRLNIALQVCEDGYIWTNVVDTGALFYVGEENTQAFIDYVLKECDGYETVYIYEEDGVLKSLFGSDFPRQTGGDFWDKLFEKKEDGASSPSMPANTQSSKGYNPMTDTSSGSDSGGAGAAAPSTSAVPQSE